MNWFDVMQMEDGEERKKGRRRWERRGGGRSKIGIPIDVVGYLVCLTLPDTDQPDQPDQTTHSAVPSYMAAVLPHCYVHTKRIAQCQSSSASVP